MKPREIANILKSKLPVEEKKAVLDKELKKQSKVKKAVGIATVAVIATGVTKIVTDKIKERKMIKEIEEQEEAEFWEDYYDDFENVPVDQDNEEVEAQGDEDSELESSEKYEIPEESIDEKI